MWRSLGTFTVRGGPEGDRQVKVCVAWLARRLGLPAGFLERIQAAVARAALNAARLPPESSPGAGQPVEVQVLITRGQRPRNAGDAGPVPLHPSPPDPVAGLLRAGQPPFRGWGFFLIEQPAGQARPDGHPPGHRIELFLYPEGGLAAGEG